MINAYAAMKAGGQLEPYSYDPGELGPGEVEIDIQYCGVCHSDLSMLKNDWQLSDYPFVPGHEVVGNVAAKGEMVHHLEIGQPVGLGWFAQSCMTCEWCQSGHHNLCQESKGLIVGRHGGFADKVRAHSGWVIPLPDNVNPAVAGPLFCGGITVFNPIVQFSIKPTDRVGVIGIGGLGHMAIRFLDAWGCDVTAFSTSADKEAEARNLGADHFVNTRVEGELEKRANSFDMILSTVNADLDWRAYVNALRQKGRLHFVGAVPGPLSFDLFPLLMGQKSVSASPLGSPATTAQMLEFAARHAIEPVIETFPMDQVNDAMEHLHSGKARYRIVLKNEVRA